MPAPGSPSKRPAFQPLDEQRQPGDDTGEPRHHRPEIRKRLLQDDDLEKGNDQDDGRQVSHRTDHSPYEGRQHTGHGAFTIAVEHLV